MSNVTLEGIASLLKEELKPINARLESIEATQAKHTTNLANLATDVKKVLDEKTVSAKRFDRLEQWAQLVCEKLGIRLEL
jgi:hypothetical protein